MRLSQAITAALGSGHTRRVTETACPLLLACVGSGGPKRLSFIAEMTGTSTPQSIQDYITKQLNAEFPDLFLRGHNRAVRNLVASWEYKNYSKFTSVYKLITFAHDVKKLSAGSIAKTLADVGL